VAVKLTPRDIAQVAHEANRGLQMILNDPNNPPSPHWDDASNETRNSAISGVMAVLTHPNRTAQQSHIGWVAFKLANDWRYGPVKDEVAKTHPDLVPFEDLPKHEQAKDELFVSVVNALRWYCVGAE
jgi:RyR domain.